MFQLGEQSMQSRDGLVGVSFWGWAGEGRGSDVLWKDGDTLLADTPIEQQGRYSVFDSDASTARLIANYAKRFRKGS